MKAAALTALVLLAAPGPAADLASRLEGDTTLAEVKLGSRVADFIALHASKEDTENLGPDARGFRRFRVLPSARPKELDDIVVYFRENQVMLVAIAESHASDDAGSWSHLIATLSERFGEEHAVTLAPDRRKMLLTFAVGERAKTNRLREVAAWATHGGEVGAFWLEDAWGKKRTYVLTLARTAEGERPDLTALWTAEKVFFGEYNTYSTDLVAMSFRPESGGTWVYGFCNEFPPELAGINGFDPKRNHSMHPVIASDADKERLAPLADPCAKLQELGLAERFQVTGHSFEAFAIGNTDADADVEVWSIDETKEIERVRSDSE